MAIILRNKTTVYGLTTDLATLQQNITNEETRATGVEGALANLNAAFGTTDRATLVAAINAELAMRTAAITQEVTDRNAAIKVEKDRAEAVEGALLSLTTTAKGNLVAAINELDFDLGAEVTRATGVEGALADLTTSVKTDLVSAINSEVSRAKGAEGVLADLTTTAKGNLVVAINEVKSSAASNLATLQGTVDTINGDSTVTGSFRKAIADVIDMAPEALNTLKEIAAYIEVNPESPISAIQQYVEGVVSNLKGSVTAANDTLAELETNLNSEIANRIADVNAEETRATTAEGVLTTAIATEKSRAEGAEQVLTTAVATEKTRAEAAELVLRTDLATEVSARIAAMSAEVTAREAADTVEMNARKAQAAIPALQSVTVAGDKIVLAAAPQQGVAGILNFATVRYVDPTGIAYDAPVAIDASDTTGKTFTVLVDVANQWNGLSVQVQYVKAAV